jgi:arginyl-tRNA synthetase
MPIFETIFLPNPDIDRRNLLRAWLKEQQQEVFYKEELDDLDLTGCYEFVGNDNGYKRSEVIKNFIFDNIYKSLDEDIKISLDVLNYTHKFLDKLYPSLIEELEEENIYSTPYGTVIFDWEKDDDNVVSVEIGANKLGYFIEKAGVDVKQIDSVSLEDEENFELLQDLSLFMSA